MDANTQRLAAGLISLATTPARAAGGWGAGTAGAVVIDQPESRSTLAELGHHLHAGRSGLLMDPHWGLTRKEQAVALAQSFIRPPHRPPAILIPTGGTTGGLRFAIHTADSLIAAATGYLSFFGADAQVWSILPAHHISGLMPAIRVIIGGGSLACKQAKEWLSPSAPCHWPDPHNVTLSLVPTQLVRLMDTPERIAWLRGFRRILLGGARADLTLLARAGEARIPLAPCYGMTETAALVCALTPEQFLAGQRGCGRPLPHVALRLSADEHRIEIQSPAVCEGYWPPVSGFSRDWYRTSDHGWIDPSGSLHIQGRLDRMIVTGGEKVDPSELEAVLQRLPAFAEAVVLGIPDPLWGEAVAVVWVGPCDGANLQTLRDALRGHLAGWQLPKVGLRLDAFPRTSVGKIDLDAVRSLLVSPPSGGSIS